MDIFTKEKRSRNMAAIKKKKKKTGNIVTKMALFSWLQVSYKCKLYSWLS